MLANRSTCSVTAQIVNSLVVGSLGLLLGLLAFANFANAKQPKVLLIGADGLRVDAFRKADTPALDGLIAAGIVDWQTSVISEQVTSSDPVSSPGWTTFLTGVWADRHGVTDNSFQGRDRKRGPHAFELAKRVRPEIRTASFLDGTPLEQHVTTDADINVVVKPTATTDIVAVALRHLGIQQDPSWGLAGSTKGWLKEESN